MDTEIKPVSLKRRIFRWVKVFILIYCSIGIALFYLQEQFLFHPDALPASYRYQFNVPFEEMNININKDENLNLVRFMPDSPTRGAVLYFHGNMSNINRYANFARTFTAQGYEVWMPDYPGFGKTTGERTEDRMYAHARQVYKLATGKYSSDSIIIYGKSMGTGIASWVARNYKARKLILETPYYSIPSLFSCYAPIYPTYSMSKYKLRSGEYLKEVTMPVTIFHGDDDEVIPYRCAAKLKRVLKAGDEFVTIKNGRHNNLADFDVYKRKLDSLLMQ